MIQLISSAYLEMGRRVLRPGVLPKLMMGMMPGGGLVLEAGNLAGRMAGVLSTGLNGQTIPTQLFYVETLKGAFVLHEDPPAEVMKWRIDAVTKNTKVTFDSRCPHACIVLQRVNRAKARDLERGGYKLVPLVPDTESRPIPLLTKPHRAKRSNPPRRQQARIDYGLRAVADLAGRQDPTTPRRDVSLELMDRLPTYC